MSGNEGAMIEKKKTLWATAVATFLGIGYIKPAPGTWGSMGAVLVWGAFAIGAHFGKQELLAATLAGIVVVIIAGVPAATIAEREAGRTDPGFVVIDEVAGQWVALLFCPPDWGHALIALFLFRLLDVTKPFPIRRIEQLHGGWGIVFDDVGAGLYALGIASLVRIWY